MPRTTFPPSTCCNASCASVADPAAPRRHKANPGPRHGPRDCDASPRTPPAAHTHKARRSRRRTSRFADEFAARKAFQTRTFATSSPPLCAEGSKRLVEIASRRPRLKAGIEREKIASMGRDSSRSAESTTEGGRMSRLSDDE